MDEDSRSGTRVLEVDQTWGIRRHQTSFKRAVEVHGVPATKWAVFLALQLTGKVLQVYVAMRNDDAKSYDQTFSEDTTLRRRVFTMISAGRAMNHEWRSDTDL